MHLNCNGENETAMMQLNNGQTTVISVDDGTDDAQEHITPDVHESVSIIKREPTTIDDMDTICYSPSWSMHIESDERQQHHHHHQQQQRRYDYSGRIQREEDPSHEDDVIECDTMMSSSPSMLCGQLKFNRNTMDISVKRTAIKTVDRLKRRRLQQPPPFSRRNMTIDENIICSPQFEHMTDVDTNDSGANGHQTMQSHFGQSNNYVNSYQDDDIDNSEYHAAVADNDIGNGDDSVGNSALKMARDQRQSSRLMELIRTKDQLRSAVVLRSPRGGQRTYTTDALYSALMDVKSGESIYR